MIERFDNHFERSLIIISTERCQPTQGRLPNIWISVVEEIDQLRHEMGLGDPSDSLRTAEVTGWHGNETRNRAPTGGNWGCT